MRLTVKAAQISDVGGREINQDCLGAAEVSAGTCWVVADGLGGHRGGEVASRIAVNTVVDAFRQVPSLSPAALEHALRCGHDRIVAARADDPDLQHMSTTAVALVTDFTHAAWAHVGDSRLYFFRGGRLVAHTRDHSVPQVLADGGEIDPSAIRCHPDRSKLLKSLGAGDFKPSVSETIALAHGDAFLLCTDGFWEFVTEAEMEADLAASQTPEGWLKAMHPRLAHRVPPDTDNYTALAIHVGDRRKAGALSISWPQTLKLALLTGALMAATVFMLLTVLVFYPLAKRWIAPPPVVLPKASKALPNNSTPSTPPKVIAPPPERSGALPPGELIPEALIAGEAKPSAGSGKENPPGPSGGARPVVPSTLPAQPRTPAAAEPLGPGASRGALAPSRGGQVPPVQPDEASVAPAGPTPESEEPARPSPPQATPPSSKERSSYRKALADFRKGMGGDNRAAKSAQSEFKRLTNARPHEQIGPDEPYAPNYHLGVLAEKLTDDLDEGRREKCEIWRGVEPAIRERVWKKNWKQAFETHCGEK